MICLGGAGDAGVGGNMDRHLQSFTADRQNGRSLLNQAAQKIAASLLLDCQTDPNDSRADREGKHDKANL